MSRPIKKIVKMSKTTHYRQCKLQKDNRIQTSYIPHEFAIKGDTLKLKNDAGEWEDGWVVKEAYSKVESQYVEAYENVWRKHRKVTDI